MSISVQTQLKWALESSDPDAVKKYIVEFLSVLKYYSPKYQCSRMKELKQQIKLLCPKYLDYLNKIIALS